jgi:sterol desaturase/sphingolipid hydroxylase (fatty acid hydroxylase superfamily)
VVTILIASAIGIEAYMTWRTGSPTYTLRETELSLALAAGSLALSFYLPSLTVWLPKLLQFRPVAVPSGVLGLALLIVAGDFMLYWAHRGSHAFRWQWAAHEAHHTSTRLNFLASLREGWTDLPAGIWLYSLPLAAFGFTATQWTCYFLVNFCWQMFAHNEWCPKLGWLEAVLVTPSHHRVHHDIARNKDPKNLANIFIVWDRLFGTFEAEGSVPVRAFGVANRRCTSVLDVAFGEWRAMLFETRGEPAQR